MKTIEVLVRPDGAVQIETKGFAGPACQEASKQLEKALGQSERQRRTADFYQPAANDVNARQDQA